MGDYRNRIRHFRQKNNLSQRQLAVAVGTSQQQIQRYETESPVEFHMAVTLANILKTPLAKLFPESKAIVQKISNERDPREVLSDPEINKGFLKAGIEVDPCVWTARVVVRGGDPQRPRLYPIHVHDKDRVGHYLEWGYQGSVEAKQSDEEARFFVFDAGDRTVAVNMDHLILWQNCWDPPRMETMDPPAHRNNESEDSAEDEEFSCVIHVYLADYNEPLKFDVDADDEQRENLDEDEGEFRDLLFTLDSEPEKDSFISFTDQDGETVHLRVRDIAMLEIAKDVTDPEPLEENEVSINDMESNRTSSTVM
jgi:transcriptional regulator with XRE-family HTH domain